MSLSVKNHKPRTLSENILIKEHIKNTENRTVDPVRLNSCGNIENGRVKNIINSHSKVFCGSSEILAGSSTILHGSSKILLNSSKICDVSSDDREPQTDGRTAWIILSFSTFIIVSLYLTC